MGKLNVLHISDFHFGCPDPNKEMGIITRQLTVAIENHVNDHSKPDLCILSGDLVHSGIESQFDNAEKWLKSLVNIIGDECLLFIVPGNHDVKRPKQDIRKNPKKSLRHAHSSQDSFGAFNQEIAKGQCLIDFRKWHNEAKTRIPNIISDWEESVFGYHCKKNLHSIPVAILGMNTAVLSCGDDDKGKLVADISYLNSFLEQCDPKKELIIVVSHHPIGMNENDRWLAGWNDQLLRNILLQNTGPHLYFHGHLHKSVGYSMNMTSGQSLAFFAAGAAYQGSNYPQRFSFYNIDLFDGTIQAHAYKYDSSNDSSGSGSGEWLYDIPNSRSVYAVLPRLDSYCSHQPKDNIDLLQELVQQHIRVNRLIKQIIPSFGLTVLGHDEKRALLDQEFTEEKAADLTNMHPANSIPAELIEASQLLESGKNEEAASYLLAVREKDSEYWKNEPHFSELLLSAVCGSKNAAHWKEALPLIPKYGKAIHYNWLSYAMWSEGQLDKAISLAEKAFSLLKSPPDPNEELLTDRICNNLAYYYADSNRQDKADEALRLIERALSHVDEKDDDKKDLYLMYLDTRGFVRIALGQSIEEIISGMTDCAKAYSLGYDETLYLKHTVYASERLKLNNTTPNIKPQDQ